MKNKFILSFLLIPVFVACQNTVNVSSSSSPQPSKSSINNISPSPTKPVPTPFIFVDRNATPIIESNMQPVLVYPSKPPLPEMLTYPDSNTNRDKVGVYGKVYDENNKLIDGVTINIVNSVHSDSNGKEVADYYNLSLTTKTISGIFALKNSVFEGLFLNISAEKEGYTKRYSTVIKESPFYEVSFNDKTQKTYLTNTPEIQYIKINKNIINKYIITNEFQPYKRDETDKYRFFPHILDDIEIPKFKMLSVDFLEIELNFNNSMIKDSVENNLQIESIDKKIIYDKNVLNSSCKWSNKDKSVVFYIPILKNKENIKYRLYFKEPFIDIYNHTPYKDEYISLQNDIRDGGFSEISKNIVFEIAGSK